MATVAAMTDRQALAYQLRIQFELPPDRPSETEFEGIIESARRFIARHGRSPSKDEWRSITAEHVQFDGEYFYKGLNFQDLNALFAVIRAQASQPKR